MIYEQAKILIRSSEVRMYFVFISCFYENYFQTDVVGYGERLPHETDVFTLKFLKR